MTGLLRAVFAVVLVVLVAWSGATVKSYGSQYYFVRATRGVHGQDVFERHLRRAVELDPTNGVALLRLAAMHLVMGKPGAALEFQRSGMAAFRPLRGYAQLGNISERLEQYDEARAAYERVLRMDPGNRDALERASALAYKTGDSARLQAMTDQLLRVDPANLNAYYLRGADAERQGNYAAAFNHYVTLSTVMSRTPGDDSRLVFRRDDVAEKIRALRRLLPDS